MAKDELKKNKKKKGKDKAKDKVKDKGKDKGKDKKAEKKAAKILKEVHDVKPVKAEDKVRESKGAKAIGNIAAASKYDFLLSMSLEDYLEQIYILNMEGKKVRVTDIASELGISKPSVNRAINNLVEMAYVEHDTYGDIALTKKGKDIAKHIYSKHMAFETFLVEVVGVPEDRARKEARDASHYLSGDTLKRIREL